MNTTYGDHAERAATALAFLVRGDALPATLVEQVIALGSRDIIISVLRDRLRDQFATQVRNDDPRADRPVMATALQAEPLVELGYVLERLPRLPPEDRLSPIDVLGKVADPIAAAWVDAARNVLVADHILATAPHRPWLNEPEAHAALATDTAQLVEAIVVLDERIEPTGALANHLIADRSSGETRPAAAVVTARLFASTIERLARWSASYTGIDLVYTAPPRPPEHEQPVRLVQVPGDLAAGQRQLESFLSPMANNNLRGRYRLAADTANLIALNQTVLLVDLRERLATSPALDTELVRVEGLIDLFGSAVHGIRGLHDATGPRQQRLLRDQQQEISVGVRHGHVRALTDRQATDLLDATESTLATWAGAVRREAGRKSTTFRVARRGTIEEPVYGRIRKDGPAVRALTALARVASRRMVTSDDDSTPSRSDLRDTLAQTPPFEIIEHWPGPGRPHHPHVGAGRSWATSPRR